MLISLYNQFFRFLAFFFSLWAMFVAFRFSILSLFWLFRFHSEKRQKQVFVILKRQKFSLFVALKRHERRTLVGTLIYMCVNSMKYSANRRDNKLQCLNNWTDHSDGKFTVQSWNAEHFTFHYFLCPVKIQVGTLISKYVYYIE